MARRKKNAAANHLEISAVQLLSAAAIVFVSFVLPAGALQYYQSQPAAESIPYVAVNTTNGTTTPSNSGGTTGSVAGVATNIPTNWLDSLRASLNLELESERGMLTVAGLALMVTGLALIGYLIITPRPQNKYFAEFKHEVSDFEREVVAKWN